MRNAITVRVPKSLSAWLKEESARTGLSQGRIIREQLERVRQRDNGTRSFMRLAGIVRGGPRDVSTRKGYSRK